MIPFDFAYFKPVTLADAVQTFLPLQERGRQPLYFSGGTEIITFARVGGLYTEAVLDVKGIPECRAHQFHQQHLIIGGAVSLGEVAERHLWPLLSATVKRVADHTSQQKITVGGNLCSQIPYREAVLPFLLADSQVVITGPSGTRRVGIREVFDGEMRLTPGELLVQLWTEKGVVERPWFHVKKTRLEEIDYPLVTLAAMRADDGIRVAVSGALAAPFRSVEMEAALNGPGSRDERVAAAVGLVPGPFVEDMRGSGEYRAFLLQGALADMLVALERGEAGWPRG